MLYQGSLISRVKANLSMRSKKTYFEKKYPMGRFREQYTLREPTPEELERSQRANRQFIQHQKRLRLIGNIVCFTIGSIILIGLYFFLRSKGFDLQNV